MYMIWIADLWVGKQGLWEYHVYHLYLDRQAWENSVDPRWDMNILIEMNGLMRDPDTLNWK